jgi:hypothetical protein
MFYCEVLKKFSKPGEKLNRIVTHIRKRVYTKRMRNEETKQIEVFHVAEGVEIVKEINASKDGAELWEKLNPNGPEMIYE